MSINNRRRTSTTILFLLVLRIFSFVSSEQTQDYGDYDYGNDYSQDNLYHDYARKQQEKVGGGGGLGLGKILAGGVAGFFVGGKVHSSRATKQMKKKHLKDQKNLYTQYYNDVYKLQEQNAELQYVVEQLQQNIKQLKQNKELEALQRDYEEFKQPDVDGDERISRAEFNMYVNTYLKNYPGLEEKDYPKFEDFDHDNDGYVSFQEYAEQMALQVQKAEREQAGKKNSAQNVQKVDSLKGLYGETTYADNFKDLYGNYNKLL